MFATETEIAALSEIHKEASPLYEQIASLFENQKNGVVHNILERLLADYGYASDYLTPGKYKEVLHALAEVASIRVDLYRKKYGK